MHLSDLMIITLQDVIQPKYKQTVKHVNKSQAAPSLFKL